MSTLLTAAICQYSKLPKGNGITTQGFFSLADNLGDFPQLSSELSLPKNSKALFTECVSGTVLILQNHSHPWPDCGPRAMFQIVHPHGVVDQ